MDDLGKQLWSAFLDKVWPHPTPSTEIDHASAADVAELFFNSAKPILDAAAEGGNVWSTSAVAEVDEALWQIALTGDCEMRLKLSPEGAEELSRRWRYAIIATHLESEYGPPNFRIPVPAKASDLIRGTAVMLSILGGPARDYPRAMYSNLRVVR